jgi:hypothetical protein
MNEKIEYVDLLVYEIFIAVEIPVEISCIGPEHLDPVLVFFTARNLLHGSSAFIMSVRALPGNIVPGQTPVSGALFLAVPFIVFVGTCVPFHVFF